MPDTTVYNIIPYIGINATGGDLQDIKTSAATAVLQRNYVAVTWDHPFTVDSASVLQSGFTKGYKSAGTGVASGSVLVYGYTGTLGACTLLASSNIFLFGTTASTITGAAFTSPALLVSGSKYIVGIEQTLVGGNASTRGRVDTFLTHSTGGYVITGNKQGFNYYQNLAIAGSSFTFETPLVWVTYTGGIDTNYSGERYLTLYPTGDSWIGYQGTGTSVASGLGGSGNHWSYIDDLSSVRDISDYVYATGTNNTDNFYFVGIPTGTELGVITAVRSHVEVRKTQSYNTATTAPSIGISGAKTRATGTAYRASGGNYLITAPLVQEWTTNPWTTNRWTWEQISSLNAGHTMVTQNGWGDGVWKSYIEVFYKPLISTAGPSTQTVTGIVPAAIATNLNPSLTLGAISFSPNYPGFITTAFSPSILSVVSLQPFIPFQQTLGQDPGINLGSISLQPDSSKLKIGGMDPSVSIGGISVVPNHGNITFYGLDPSASFTLTTAPLFGTAKAVGVDPLITAGGISSTPLFPAINIGSPTSSASGILRPIANGITTPYSVVSHDGASEDWDAVNGVIPDDETSYVWSNDVIYGNELFVLESLPISISDIISIDVHIRGLEIGVINVDQRYVLLKFYDGSTVYSMVADTPYNITYTTTYDNYTSTCSTNPATELPWTWADIANGQFGFRHNVPLDGLFRTTQFYIVVNYRIGPSIILGAVNVTPGISALKIIGIDPGFSTSNTVTPQFGTAQTLGIDPQLLSVLSLTPDFIATKLVGIDPNILTSQILSTQLGVAAMIGIGPSINVGPMVVGSDSPAVNILGKDPNITLGSIVLNTVNPSVNIAGESPSIQLGAVSASVSIPSMFTYGISPNISLGINIGTDIPAINLTPLGPNIQLGGITAQPEISNFKIIGFPPSVLMGLSIAPTIALMNMFGPTPTINVGAVSVQTTTPYQTILGLDPALLGFTTVSPDQPRTKILGLDPSTVVQGISLTPSQAVVSLFGISPDISLGSVQVSPQEVGFRIEAFSPSVSTAVVIIPGIGPVTIVGIDPTVSVGAAGAIVAAPDFANIRFWVPSPSTSVAAPTITGVAGGLFVNAANFINYYVSQYAATSGKTMTLRDRFPLVDDQITAPMICYETEFMTMDKLEISSNFMTYRISFLIDIIGRNRRERDQLFKIVHTGLEGAKSNVDGIGDFQLQSLDILGTWKVDKIYKKYDAMAIRVVLSVTDFKV